MMFRESSKEKVKGDLLPMGFHDAIVDSG